MAFVAKGVIVMRKHVFVFGLVFASLLIVASIPCVSHAREPHVANLPKDLGPDRVLVLDGSFVHNVGQLQMHMSNWGIFGSMPSGHYPFSDAPSAQWPAGSGVEYLYVVGLWVGAIKDGIPSVSTSAFQSEFRPTNDPIDIIYRTHEGALGGNPFPFAGADDDHDGLVDEDRLDGRDNDLDGRIDEDFAAISKQMFTSWYTDNQPETSRLFPEHRPLDIKIEQESFQWDDPRFDDFIGVALKITNIGHSVLEQVYLGAFADFDVGPRTTPDYWADDAVGAWFGERCTDIGPVELNVMYGYDSDGDGGMTPGYFGLMMLGHTIDPLGIKAPMEGGISAYRVFSGDQPFENGGDPVNDFQRYEVLSSHRIDRNSNVPRDYRSLLCTGPFARLAPGESIMLHIGFVAGTGLEGMLDNAASGQRLFNGTWYDVDRNPVTGVDRRETPVHGPAHGVIRDRCRPDLAGPVDVPAGATLWVNADCEQEQRFLEFCRFQESDSLIFRTGVAGKETQIHWVLGRPLALRAAMDIRPGSCPNSLNMNRSDFAPNGNPKKGGELPVAVLGMVGFDVRDIDIASVRLEGAPPLDKKPLYKDTGGPATEGGPCACASGGPDGHLDLVFKFSSEEIAQALGAGPPPSRGDSRELTLVGTLRGGRVFEAVDCVTIVGNPGDGEEQGGNPGDGEARGGQKPRLGTASPNPFNPITNIAYCLPEEMDARIAVYDASGRLVEVLVNGVQSAGEHEIQWNARGVASGIYFCRLSAGGFMQVKKIILIR
jgi:hypothetical protein